MDMVRTIASQRVANRRPRRLFLRQMGRFAALGGMTLLGACQRQPETVVVTPPPAAPSPAAAPGASPAASPAASPVAVASPSPAAAASPSPAAPSAVAGRPMYQMDSQHTGRSPHAGPRQAVLLRTFDTARGETP